MNTKKVAVKFDYFKILGLVRNFFNHITMLISFFYFLNSKSIRDLYKYKRINLIQIPVKAPDTARGSLEITYLDEELR